MPPKRKAPEDNTTSRRVTRRTLADAIPVVSQNDVPIDEPDELNIRSTKPLVPPSTPGPRLGPSRVLMDCVEITTPRAITLRSDATRTSPAPNGANGMKLNVHQVPSTPSRRLRSGPASPFIAVPSTPLQARPPVTPHISPSKLQFPPNDVPLTPSKRPSSPKKSSNFAALLSPVKLPTVLPAHLAPCLREQKRAILNAIRLSSPSSEHIDGNDHSSINSTAYTQLQSLLHGTTTRGEGNSCLLLGPRGSGKTSLLERAIRNLSEEPIVLRLSGHAQHNDRLALREIARQLSQQTGKSFLGDLGEDTEDLEEEPNPFIDPGPTISVPPPSHLPALISVLPTLSRPTVVILDAFDLFAQHARQSLLYCLLDTVQSCRVGQGNHGIAVVGITTRIDTINLLEKRVKSRFSGRMIWAAPPSDPLSWIDISRRFLNVPVDGSTEWGSLWAFAVQTFLGDRKVAAAMKETFAFTKDIRMLERLLIAVVTNLRTTSPFPTASHISTAISAQRLRQKFSNLQALSYPSICLLIAAMHAYSAGHDMITFEMLYDAFREEFRISSAAPIQIEGGSIGMAKCSRGVLMSSFEELVGAHMFMGVAVPSTNIPPEFVRYHCLVERSDVKRAVNAMGQTNVTKWFKKAS